MFAVLTNELIFETKYCNFKQYVIKVVQIIVYCYKETYTRKNSTKIINYLSTYLVHGESEPP